MSDLVKIETFKPEIPKEWNYDESVKKVRRLGFKWKNLTLEILEELYIAREKLRISPLGGRPKKTSKYLEVIPTWTQYCKDINISLETARLWLKPLDWLRLYNIWTLAKLEEDKDFFGAFPGIFMENLLYYHTEENDLIYDPFAGSGTTIDICKKMGRNFYCSDLNVFSGREKEINNWDVADGLPANLTKPDLVFLDPPYWRQAKGRYSDSLNDLGNMDIINFYFIFNRFLNLLMGKEINKIAIVIAPTQYPNENHEFEDHIFNFNQILSSRYYIEMRYVIPYSTEQYNGTQVEIMKKEKKAINLIRDLVIWALKKD